MAGTTETTQPDPIVRFRLRTLLQTTTAFAVLAAVAGWYYRRVDADAQRRLLTFWLTLLPCTVAAFFWRLRDAWAPGMRSGVRFVVYSSNGKSKRRRSFSRFIVIPLLLIWYVGASHNVASKPSSPISRDVLYEIADSACGGLFLGFISSAMLMIYVRRPVILSERGIPLTTRDFVPWGWIHAAQWLPGQPSVMKLRRLAGDLFIDVPDDSHEAVEAFIREKISPTLTREYKLPSPPSNQSALPNS
jgi:hypothetical protein